MTSLVLVAGTIALIFVLHTPHFQASVLIDIEATAPYIAFSDDKVRDRSILQFENRFEMGQHRRHKMPLRFDGSHAAVRRSRAMGKEAIDRRALDRVFHLLSRRNRVERLELARESREAAAERLVAHGLDENRLDAWDAVWDKWE